MRLIDADEIRIKPDFIFYGVCGTPVIRCEDLARIINDMPTIESQKWISVSERLPDPRIDVWCNSDLGQTIGYYDETCDMWFKNDYTELIVTAWMPLPECYRGDSDG